MNRREDVRRAVVALADLCGRAEATSLEIDWECPHTGTMADGEEKTHNCPGVTWNAQAFWRGARLFTSSPSVEGATTALAQRILDGATCRCGMDVTLGEPTRRQCRWALVGDRWEPGCDVPSVRYREARRP
jgi:hypothetical protein